LSVVLVVALLSSGCVNPDPTEEPAAQQTAVSSPPTTAAADLSAVTAPRDEGVDVSGCPEGWDDHAGFDEKSVRVASHGGLGGLDHAVGMSSAFERANQEGGVGGRQIEMLTVNLSPGDAPQYLEGLTWALGQEPLAVSAVFGGAAAGEMAERVDDACIPNLYGRSLRMVSRPDLRQWTVPGFAGVEIESAAWVAWTERQFGPSAVVGVLAMDRWGEQQVATIEQRVEQLQLPFELHVVRHRPEAEDLAAEVAILAQHEPDVVLVASFGVICSRAVTARAQSATLATVPLVLPQHCDAYAFGDGAELGEDNVWRADTIGSGIVTEEERERLAGRLDYPIAAGDFGMEFWHGWLAGWMTVEAMREADTLPGGLSRTNLLIAAQAIQRSHPYWSAAQIGPIGDGHFTVSMQRWSLDQNQWVDDETPGGLIVTEPATILDENCGPVPDRLSMSTAGWDIVDGTLSINARPVVYLDGLETPLSPHFEGVAAGTFSITSADGYSQHGGRLVEVDDGCSFRFVAEPEEWVIKEMATRPAPYEVLFQFNPSSNYVIGGGTIPDRGPDIGGSIKLELD
jgi:hypothetical protein